MVQNAQNASGAKETARPLEELLCQVQTALETVQKTCLPGWFRIRVVSATLAASGHYYLQVQGQEDQGRQVQLIVWRRHAAQIPFKPEAFQRLLAHVTNIRYYGAKATVELTATQLAMEEEDVRDHEEALARLMMKQTLVEEGVLNPEMQCATFTLQHVSPGARIVAISSRTQGFQDFVQVLQERRALFRVYLLPTLVQGEHAPEQIAHALQTEACQPGVVNVVALIRGGGDAADLASFSAPVVVRAIARCDVRTLSGVGHSTDQTLTDFAVDHAAITPSMAAVALSSAQECFLAHRLNLTCKARQLAATSVDDIFQNSKQANIGHKCPLLRPYFHTLSEHENYLAKALTATKSDGLRRAIAHTVQRLVGQMEMLWQQGLLERQLLQLSSTHANQSCAAYMRATTLRAKARQAMENVRGTGLGKRRQMLQMLEHASVKNFCSQSMKRGFCVETVRTRVAHILAPWARAVEQHVATLSQIEEGMRHEADIESAEASTERPKEPKDEPVLIYRQNKRIRRAMDLDAQDVVSLVFPDGAWHATCTHRTFCKVSQGN